ncbi:SMP-30/gluconolactonase/LRE family protein [Streptomyces sp. URMC 124]|uniref:SMP-30/gluconolactonase/LRE family protein n=1 Tax=Streptomyces sp. URMC 124 TaxID=3423405 RepID=UPI003F53B6E9
MRIRKAFFAAGLASALLAGASQVPAAAAGAPARAGARLGTCAQQANMEVFRKGGVPVLDWRENLEFDGRGTLWVAHLVKNRVEGYAPDGTLRTSFPVSGPGGLRRGPDGMMYVNYGVSPLATDGGILRFDPAAAAPKPEKVVSGIRGINGLAIDASGNFYLSRELSTGIVKVRPDGTKDEQWTRAADVFGANGLEIAGDQLYVSAITDTSSPVYRIPLNDPARRTTVTHLSRNLLDMKFLDDLTYADGSLIVASFRDGELIRVDPDTGRSCVVASGLRMPSSVRVARGFGEHSDQHALFVVEASGRILKVTLR